MLFRDVIRATLGAEDEEAVEPRPIIHLPRKAATGVANLGRTRIGSDCEVTRWLN